MKVSNTIPASIVRAATDLLTPYCAELTYTSLIRALKAYTNSHAGEVAPIEPPLTITEAAHALGVSRPTMYRIIRENRVRVIQFCESTRRIDRDSVREFIKNGTQAHTAEQAVGM